MPLDVHRIEIEKPELANRFHQRGVSRVPQRLVLHRRDLPLVAERHRRQSAGRVERLERSDLRSELHRLALRQRLHARPLPAAQHPRQRRVVVEHALERVDDLVVERWLGLLRQPADVDPHRVDFVELRESRVRRGC